MNDSIFATFKKSLAVLSSSQLRSTWIQVLYSLVYAFLELISVAVLIPLVAQLSNSASPRILNFQFPWVEDHFFTLILTIAVIFLLKNMAIMVITSKQAHFISRISTEISTLLFKNFYKQSWLNYIQINTEDYIRKIKEVPSDFAHHVLHNFIRIVTDILTGLILIIFLSLTEIRILLILVGMVLPVWVIYLTFKKTVIQNINKSFREITPVTSSVLAQSVESFMEARLYGKENFFVKKYTSLRKTSSDYLAKLKAASYVPALFFEVAGIIIILGLLYYSTTSSDKSQSFRLIAFVTIAVYKIFPILNRILNGTVQVMAFRYTIKELQLAMASKAAEPSIHRVVFNDLIALNNISFAYPSESSHFRLNDVNLEINKGDFMVITGPSGSGKTTLLNILAGLLDGYLGDVTIDKKIVLSERHSWNTHLGFVPQTPVILQDSIRNNIAFGTNEDEINDALVSSAAQAAIIFDFISELPNGFGTQLGENGLTISGGQRQCIALARALYHQPKVLLLDEPTNQLDVNNKKKLLKSLRICQSKGLTIILATHDLIAINYCNKRVELRNGSVERITLH